MHLIRHATYVMGRRSRAVSLLRLDRLSNRHQRTYLTRTEAIDRVLTTLWFFSHSEQSDAADATGYKGRFLPQSRVTS